jgi:hypothetical protein
MYSVMAAQRHTPKRFPLGLFTRQWNDAGESRVEQGQVYIQALRSRKHATVEISPPFDDPEGGSEIHGPIIVKHYDDADVSLMDREQEVLSFAMSVGVAVPKVLRALRNFLVLEKVEGSTLMDVINDESVLLERKKAAVASLGAWLRSFHFAFQAYPKANRRGDANLKNFIFTGTGAIVGLDFEEASLEDPVVDLHEVVDSIVQSRPGIYSEGMPAIEWKFDLCDCLLRSYATAACKHPIEIIKDPARFIDAQLRVMLRLAEIRGSTSLLATMVPVINEKLGIIVDRLISRDML